MTPRLETRFLAETKASGRRLVGYAARYGVVADLGTFRERIEPGAFSASLESRDILALFDHDPGRVLGRTKTKTLTLNDEPEGLAFDLSVPDTTAGADALALAARGDLGGASIGFIVEEEKKESGVRVIQRAALFEISLVSAGPAYAQTTVEARRRGGFLVFSPCKTPRLNALRRFLETV
ncbi:MAG: HK97 family phage prohead protease [Pseudomonadota bacterium]